MENSKFEIGSRVRYKTLEEQSEYLISMGYTKVGVVQPLDSMIPYIKFTHNTMEDVLVESVSEYHNKIGTVVNVLGINSNRIYDKKLWVNFDGDCFDMTLMSFKVELAPIHINVLE
jgi:hypothetical protein